MYRYSGVITVEQTKAFTVPFEIKSTKPLSRTQVKAQVDASCKGLERVNFEAEARVAMPNVSTVVQAYSHSEITEEVI